MARWNLDFLDLLTALNAAEAKYLLVGGHAVGLYGTPRATKDFDLSVEPSADNATRVVQALRAFVLRSPGSTCRCSRRRKAVFGWARLRFGSSSSRR